MIEKPYKYTLRAEELGKEIDSLLNSSHRDGYIDAINEIALQLNYMIGMEDVDTKTVKKIIKFLQKEKDKNE